MSPRSREQFEEIRETSIRKIFDASLELFGTKGYEATSISEIATAAGISKGLIYNYFDSKEALLKDMIFDLMSEGDDIVEQSISKRPEETMENLIRSIFKWLREHHKLNRILISLSVQIDKFDFVHTLSVEKMKSSLVLLEKLLQQMNFPDWKTEARILLTIFDGIAVQYMVVKEDYPLDEIEEMLVEKYCKSKNDRS